MRVERGGRTGASPDLEDWLGKKMVVLVTVECANPTYGSTNFGEMLAISISVLEFNRQANHSYVRLAVADG